MGVMFFLLERLVASHLSYCGCKGSKLTQTAQYSKTGKMTIPAFGYRAVILHSSRPHPRLLRQLCFLPQGRSLYICFLIVPHQKDIQEQCICNLSGYPANRAKGNRNWVWLLRFHDTSTPVP